MRFNRKRGRASRTVGERPEEGAAVAREREEPRRWRWRWWERERWRRSKAAEAKPRKRKKSEVKRAIMMALRSRDRTFGFGFGGEPWVWVCCRGGMMEREKRENQREIERDVDDKAVISNKERRVNNVIPWS